MAATSPTTEETLERLCALLERMTAPEIHVHVHVGNDDDEDASPRRRKRLEAAARAIDPIPYTS